MGTIVVKDLPHDVHEILQRLATERQQSFDAFVHDTLREIVARESTKTGRPRHERPNKKK